MSPVSSWDYVEYIIYETTGHIMSAPDYRCDVYDNALDFFSNQTSCEINIFSLTISRNVDNLPFLILCNSTEDTPKPFCGCQNVQLDFLQQTDRTEHAGLILNVFTCCQFVWHSCFTILICQVFDWYNRKYMISSVY